MYLMMKVGLGSSPRKQLVDCTKGALNVLLLYMSVGAVVGVLKIGHTARDRMRGRSSSHASVRRVRMRGRVIWNGVGNSCASLKRIENHR